MYFKLILTVAILVTVRSKRKDALEVKNMLESGLKC